MTGPDPAENGDAAAGRRKDELAALGRRIEAVRGREAVRSGSAKPGSGAALGYAFRIGSELVAGILLGLLVGWQLDKWLGTAPIMLILFLLLGTAGGLWNVMRTAEQMHRLDAGKTKPTSSAARGEDGQG